MFLSFKDLVFESNYRCGVFPIYGGFSKIREGGMYTLNIVCDTKHRNTNDFPILVVDGYQK